MGRGAWWATTVHEVAESWTRISDFTLLAASFFFMLVQLWDSYSSSHSPVLCRKNYGLKYQTG